MRLEAHYLQGCQSFERGNYENAVGHLSNCGKYKDADSKCLDAKYAYVMENYNCDDYTTYSYLCSLKNSKYYGAQAAFDDIYKWKVVVTAINNSSSSKTDMSSVSKWDRWYVHFKLTGGIPGGTSTNITAKAYFPDGSVTTGKTESPYHKNSSGYWTYWYTAPEYALPGTFTVYFYDDAGNLIGNDSVYITN